MIRKIPKETSTFHFYNANPKDKRTGDCVIRAIATAENKTWEEVLTDLCDISLKYKIMPNDTVCYSKYLESLGYSKCKQPRKEDNTKYTGVEFCEKLNKSYKNGYKDNSSVIAHIGGHHIVCIKWEKRGGIFKVNDTWDSTDGCIGNYWVKEKMGD